MSFVQWNKGNFLLFLLSVGPCMLWSIGQRPFLDGTMPTIGTLGKSSYLCQTVAVALQHITRVLATTLEDVTFTILIAYTLTSSSNCLNTVSSLSCTPSHACMQHTHKFFHVPVYNGNELFLFSETYQLTKVILQVHELLVPLHVISAIETWNMVFNTIKINLVFLWTMTTLQRHQIGMVFIKYRLKHRS